MNETTISKKDKLIQRIYRIIEVGNKEDFVSKMYDVIMILSIVLNLIANLVETFSSVEIRYGNILNIIEQVTAAFFLIDFILRILTAKCMYPKISQPKAILRYVTSVTGIIDLLSIMPSVLPVMFPTGAVAFRMIRVVRILRLFRINAYYDALNVITEVIYDKRQQLISSLFIILVLMMASSLCMYSLEHEAQPDVFKNAFSGIWWSVSTLLTVGYGDIYPVTTLGRLFGIGISFLGVGMVAIPTGIISAGFVNQYTEAEKRGKYGQINALNYIEIVVGPQDYWAGMMVEGLRLPESLMLTAIRRGNKIILPEDELRLQKDDVLILAARPLIDDINVELREVILEKQHDWCGLKIDELDISRRTQVVLVERRGRLFVPDEKTVLNSGDVAILCTERLLSTGEESRMMNGVDEDMLRL